MTFTWPTYRNGLAIVTASSSEPSYSIWSFLNAFEWQVTRGGGLWEAGRLAGAVEEAAARARDVHVGRAPGSAAAIRAPPRRSGWS